MRRRIVLLVFITASIGLLHAGIASAGNSSNTRAIGSGSGYSCALTNLGGVVCWGENDWGQLGNGTTDDSSSPTSVSGLTSGVVAISVGSRHACALTTGGGVKCWGFDDSGDLGAAAPDTCSGQSCAQTPIGVTGLSSGVTAIAAGGEFTCALTTGGGVKCWGANSYGELGIGSYPPYSSATPVDVTGLTSGVTSIAAGENHACAVTSAGAAKCWGNNSNSVLGASTGSDCAGTCSTSPIEVTGLGSGVASMALGPSNSCALMSDGGLKCWGGNIVGVVGASCGGNTCATPVDVTGLSSGVAQVSVGFNTACALLTSGGVKCWGSRGNGQAGDGFVDTGFDPAFSPVDVSGLSSGVTALATGWSHTCVLTTSNGAKCWGKNDHGQVDSAPSPQSTPYDLDRIETVNEISAGGGGDNHTCAVVNGGAQCWGSNVAGELGIGSTDAGQSTPQSVSGLGSSVDSISAGFIHSCALLSGGVQCWGSNNKGALGTLSLGDETSTPLSVDDLPAGSGVTAISAGDQYTCAVVSGAAKCWGWDEFGQLGDGHNDDTTSVQQVSGLTSGVTDIAAGNVDTCAIQSGAAYCWGANPYGQLATDPGTTPASNVPLAIPGLDSNVTDIATGSGDACAVVSGGVKCWGFHYSTTPSDVPGLTSDVTQVTLGWDFACALLSGGGVKCWGVNHSGQLGNGAYADDFDLTLYDVSGLTSGVASVSAGNNWACAALTSGGAACWGYSQDGELGNGNTDVNCCNTPQSVLTKNWGLAKFGQAVEFTSSAPSPAVNDTYSPAASASSGLGVTLGTTNSNCSYNSGNGHVTMTHAGTCTVTADQGGNGTYYDATQATQSFTIAKAAQTVDITSTAPTSPVVGDAYQPTATGGGSGNTVTFGTTGGNCSYDGGTGMVTMTHSGTCTVTADQLGNSDYEAATQDTQSFTVAKASQTVSFTSTAPSGAVVGDTYTPTANGGASGNAVTFGTTGGKCTYNSGSGKVTMTHVGTCTVTADQSGTNDYTAAQQQSQSFSVAKGPQTVSFSTSPPSNAMRGDTYQPAATATSGLAVTLGTSGGNCSYSSGTGLVTFDHAGSCTVTADQGGNVDWNGAPQATQTFSVGKPLPTVAISTAPNFVNINNQHAASLSGTVEPGDLVYITVTSSGGGLNAGPTQANVTGGNWSITNFDLSSLGDGTITYRVTAVDEIGQTSPVATRTAIKDTVAPTASIGTKPANPTNSTSATFGLSSSESHSTFTCKLDAATSTCGSTKSYSGLSAGTHNFSVTPTDQAGNVGSPTTYTWTVDLTPPQTTINTQPAAATRATTASFTFSSSETGSTFQCKLDGGAFAACTSPKSYSGLTNGNHMFSVNAKDAAGNLDATPATSQWLVDLVAPTTTVPAARFHAGTTLTSSIPVQVYWTGTDPSPASGIASYTLQRATGSGTFAGVTLNPSSDPVGTVAFVPGTNYTFRALAKDVAGNMGTYATTAPMHVDLTQENAPSVTYTGTWSPISNATASGGTYRQASAAGASATYTFFGAQSAAWVSAVGPDRGKADVYFDGVKQATVDLYAPVAGFKRVSFGRSLMSVGTHKLKIVATGTKNASSSAAKVDVDAFLTVGYRIGSYLYANSDAGDWITDPGHAGGKTITVTDAAGAFSASLANNANVLNGFINTADGWNWNFSAIPGQVLTAGTYLNAQYYYTHDATHPGLSVSAFNRGCGPTGVGSFKVLYADFAGGTVNHFLVQFTQGCSGAGGPQLRGEIGINMPIPPR
jgi:alpha-tubulin suppressor-like RCC1 family protein